MRNKINVTAIVIVSSDVAPVLHKLIYIPLVMVVQKSGLQYIYFLCERKKQQFGKIDLPPHTSQVFYMFLY